MTGDMLQRKRARLWWVRDSDLVSVEERSPVLTALLSFAFPGSGQVYVGDIWRGVAILVTWCVLSVTWGGLPWALIGVVAAAWGYRQARAVNKYVRARRLQGPSQQALLPYGGAPDLVALMGRAPSGAAGQPHTPDASLPEEVRAIFQLGSLARDGLIDPLRFQERKLDQLTAFIDRSDAAPEDVLSALQPLLRDGLLNDADVRFVKQLLGL